MAASNESDLEKIEYNDAEFDLTLIGGNEHGPTSSRSIPNTSVVI